MTAVPDPARLAAAVGRGERIAVAKALNLADDARPAAAAARLELLDALYAHPVAGSQVLGITGPPGVGKSTLTARLITEYRNQGRGVGVLAIDPSSRRSGGALLGDRIRMQLDPDDCVFIRSLATRDHLGGLSEAAYAAKVVLAAAYDRVIIESVGVGQMETEIADAADAVILVLQPSSGDSIQFIKAGIMEIPDVLVLNKTDLPSSRQTLRELRAVLRSADRTARPAGATDAPAQGPELVRTSAAQGDGLADLVAAADAFVAAQEASGAFTNRRLAQWRRWLVTSLKSDVGRAGLKVLGGPEALALPPGASPFTALDRARSKITVSATNPMEEASP